MRASAGILRGAVERANAQRLLTTSMLRGGSTYMATSNSSVSTLSSHFCECGCGRHTNIIPHGSTRRGHVKGQPYRFCLHHGSLRIKRVAVTKEYRTVLVRGGVRVRLHVARAERALGKPLPKKSHVHHADGSKRDDAPLVICQDTSYHRLLHARMRVKAAGGNPNTDAVCGRCRLAKDRSLFTLHRSMVFGVYRDCRECSNEDQRRRRHQKNAMCNL